MKRRRQVIAARHRLVHTKPNSFHFVNNLPKEKKRRYMTVNVLKLGASAVRVVDDPGSSHLQKKIRRA